MITMIDSIESPQTTGHPIPQAILHAQAIGAYNHGNSWPTLGPYSAARPDLAAAGLIVSITLTSDGKARCYDIESQGGHNENIGRFMLVADHSDGLPILYTFASNVATMKSFAASFGYQQGRDYYIWSAHWTGVRHICGPGQCQYPKADLTQYGFAPENCDVSVCNDYVFHGAVPVPQPATESFETMAAAVNAQGDLHVFEVAHGDLYYTYQKAQQSGWDGGVPKKQIAGLSKFAPSPGEDLVAVSAALSSDGTLHVFGQGKSGELYYTYQVKGSTNWNGGVPQKQIAGVTPLAPAP